MLEIIRLVLPKFAYQELNTPTLFVVVKELPRDALVEKQVLSHTGRVLVKDDDDELDEPTWQSREPVHTGGQPPSNLDLPR